MGSAAAATPVTLDAVTGTATAAALGAAATVFLILLLVLRELLSAYAEELPASRRRLRVEALSGALGIGVPPLMVIFSLIVLLRVAEALG